MCVCVVWCVGKKLLGRSQVRSVAERRKDKLNDYCKVCIYIIYLSPPTTHIFMHSTYLNTNFVLTA